MRHLTEEEQLLSWYGELADPDLIAHSRDCAQCREERERLRKFFAAIEDEELPSPADGYENRLWQRLQWQIDAPRERQRSWWKTAAAAAALLAVGYLAGRVADRPTQSPATAVVSSPAPAAVQPVDTDRLLQLAARQHLDRSTRLLVELSNQSTENPSLGSAPEEAENLLASTRLYRASSPGENDDAMRLLEELEPILLELAHSPEQLTAEQLTAIQKRIEEKELLLKLRLVASTLASESKPTEPLTKKPSPAV
jgi:hypothetical protein